MRQFNGDTLRRTACGYDVYENGLPNVREAVFVDGAKGRTRTGDRTIFSRELYQLSYLGAWEKRRAAYDRWAIRDSNP